MGYTRSALRLEWPEDSEFSGLVVRMKRITVRQVVRVEGLSELRKAGTSAEVEAAWSEILDTIGAGLLGWNLEDEVVTEVDGVMVVTGKAPVPATREALDDCDMDLILAIVRAWTQAGAAVPLASQPSSPTGAPEEPPDELGTWLAYEQRNQENSPAPV